MNSISTFTIGAVASSIFISAWSSFWGSGGGDSLIQTQLVETLRSQLDRRGPEALGARPCPACHMVLCETPWVSLGLSFLLGGCVSILGLFYFKFRYYPSSGVERHTRIDVSQIESGDDLGSRWAPAGRSNSRFIRERPRLMDA